MKKLLSLLIILITTQINSTAQAIESGAILNLHTKESYVVDLNARPKDLQNSNQRIVKVDVVTEIETTDSDLIITTFEEGIAYITVKLNEKNVTIKLLIDDKGDETQDYIKLDQPQKEIKNK